MKKPFIPKWMHYGTFHRRFLGPSDSKDLMGVVNALSSHLSNISGHLVSPICSLSRKGPGWEVEVSRHGDVELVRTTIAGGTTYILILYNSETWYFEYWDLGKLAYDSPKSLPVRAAGSTTTKEKMDAWLFRLWMGHENQYTPGWEYGWYYPFSVAADVGKWIPSKHMYFDEDNANKMSFYYKHLTSAEEYARSRNRYVNSGITHNTAIANAIVITHGGDPSVVPPTYWEKKNSSGSNAIENNLYQTFYIEHYVISPPAYEKPPSTTETDVTPEIQTQDFSETLSWDMEQYSPMIWYVTQYYHAAWEYDASRRYQTRQVCSAGEMDLFYALYDYDETIHDEFVGGYEMVWGSPLLNYGSVTKSRTYHGTCSLYVRGKQIFTTNIVRDYNVSYTYGGWLSDGYKSRPISGTKTQTESGLEVYPDWCVSAGPDDFICNWYTIDALRNGTVDLSTIYMSPPNPFVFYNFGTGSEYPKGMAYHQYWAAFSTAAALKAYADGKPDFADVETDGFKRSAGITSIRLWNGWYNEATGESEGYDESCYMQQCYITDDHIIAMFAITGGVEMELIHLVVNRATGKHSITRTGGPLWGTRVYRVGTYIKGVGPDAKAIEI
jgi:hypothetical protein